MDVPIPTIIVPYEIIHIDLLMLVFAIFGGQYQLVLVID